MKGLFDRDLELRLEQLAAQGLLRRLRPIHSAQGRQVEREDEPLLNFSSNDYLGLASEPALKEAAIAAVEKFGAGAGASRLVCGSLAPYHQLEEALAEFKGAEAALSFSSGYAAAMGAICALVQGQDVIAVDKLAHACIIDAARLSGARLRVFAHNDLEEAEEILQWADRRHTGASATGATRKPRTMVVTESVFSMDGDQAPLRQLVELKDKYGAWLMVDEAHATGLYGKLRRGLAEECGVSDRIEIQMGTLGKALGSAGGFICGSRRLIDWLINRARPFIFSTAPVPAAAAAATAAVGLVRSQAGEERRKRLWKNADAICARRRVKREASGSVVGQKPLVSSAIVPIFIGNEQKAVEIAEQLSARGILLPAIRYPAVARGRARLRLTVSAAHSEEDLERLFRALEAVVNY